jgi:hypothetical protein
MNRFAQVGIVAVVLGGCCFVCGVKECSAEKLLQIPPAGSPVLGTLTTAQADPNRLVLTARRGFNVAMSPFEERESQFWTLSPVGGDVVRLQLFARGRLWSVSVDPATGQVGFSPSAENVDQLWRVVLSDVASGGLRFESVRFVGNCLAGQADSTVMLQPASDSLAQVWYFDSVTPPATVQVPIQRLVTATVERNPVLPAVQTRLVNSERIELFVRISDLRTGAATDVRLPPGGFHDLEIERDAGATYVEKYEVVGPGGPLLSQQFVTPMPPASYYGFTVYQKFMQSIAIDRTGKSPTPIEDINFQAKSLGSFVLPAGDLFAGGEVDVMQLATQVDEAGGLRAVVPGVLDGADARVDPLEQAVRELQPQ